MAEGERQHDQQVAKKRLKEISAAKTKLVQLIALVSPALRKSAYHTCLPDLIASFLLQGTLLHCQLHYFDAQHFIGMLPNHSSNEELKLRESELFARLSICWIVHECTAPSRKRTCLS